MLREGGFWGTAAGCGEAAAGTDRWLWGQERELELRRQALEEERRRREQVERRLQSESARRQQLVEKEVKMREKQFSQVRGWRGALGAWLEDGAGGLGIPWGVKPETWGVDSAQGRSLLGTHSAPGNRHVGVCGFRGCAGPHSTRLAAPGPPGAADVTLTQFISPRESCTRFSVA